MNEQQIKEKIEENLSGLSEFIKDEDILNFYKGVIKQMILDAQPKWIDVKERLPEEGQEVNILINGNSLGTAVYECVGLIYEFVNESYDYFNSQDVTHWQPIPSPPQQ